nr:hypothetical protein BdHM001_34980 [Bdellovibrio sp. HM001]
MKFISIDLEMNQPSGKVIEIGAVIMDTKTMSIVDTFQVYVNPGEPISQEITDLTGITDCKVRNGVSALEGYNLLMDFHKRSNAFVNPVVWGSGESNDSLILYKQAQPGSQNGFGYRVMDCKTVYQALAASRNLRLCCGLQTAAKKIGIGWDETHGPPHRALADAYNTARVWIELVMRQKRGG